MDDKRCECRRRGVKFSHELIKCDAALMKFYLRFLVGGKDGLKNEKTRRSWDINRARLAKDVLCPQRRNVTTLCIVLSCVPSSRVGRQ